MTRVTLLLFAMLAVPASADISRLSWLAGCWAYDDAETGSEEVWLQPAGASMTGMSRIVYGGKTVSFEFMRIVEDDDGIHFFAQPGGRKPTRFTAIEIGDQSVAFENPDHDFPQIVRYKRIGDALLGRIEGTIDGEEKSADFPMHRASCDDK